MGTIPISFWVLLIIGAIWLAARNNRGFKYRKPTSAAAPAAADTGGKSIFDLLPTFKLPGKDNFLAIFLVGLALWSLSNWWGWITREGQSSLDQTFTAAAILVTGSAIYGVWTVRNEPTKWPKRVLYLVVFGVVIVGALTAIYGEEELVGATQQDLFDGPHPNAMGWINLDGDWVQVHTFTQKQIKEEASEGKSAEYELVETQLRPVHCVPEGYELFGPTGDMFPFAAIEANGLVMPSHCYKNGQPLVPISRENVPDMSNFGPREWVDWLTTTPAEKAAGGDGWISEWKISLPSLPAITPDARTTTEQEMNAVCRGQEARAGGAVGVVAGAVFETVGLIADKPPIKLGRGDRMIAALCSNHAKDGFVHSTLITTGGATRISIAPEAAWLQKYPAAEGRSVVYTDYPNGVSNNPENWPAGVLGYVYRDNDRSNWYQLVVSADRLDSYHLNGYTLDVVAQ